MNLRGNLENMGGLRGGKDVCVQSVLYSCIQFTNKTSHNSINKKTFRLHEESQFK